MQRSATRRVRQCLELEVNCVIATRSKSSTFVNRMGPLMW